jgi:hypothetical protein
MRAETRKAAQQAIARFEADYGAKYPKAVTSLRRDEAELLAFFDLPAEHWVHLRTGNVIESPFATVRLRQRVTKGAGSRQKGLLIAFKLLAMAEKRWRRVNGAKLIDPVPSQWTPVWREYPPDGGSNWESDIEGSAPGTRSHPASPRWRRLPGWSSHRGWGKCKASRLRTSGGMACECLLLLYWDTLRFRWTKT